ncbi:MAG: cyclic nucleotide-binding domain-containing protein [Chloroflexi bacterium]|nr:cyclic nucleotide-binding domain-containing protein [Chloroflexota bacterium]
MTLSTETIDFLKTLPLFARLPEDQMQEIFLLGKKVFYAVGDRLITQDGLTDCLFVMLDGRVAIEIKDVSAVGERGPKSILGELAMISQTPRNATCTAITPVTAVKFRHDQFWQYVQKSPELAVGLLTEVIYHLDETIDTLYWMSRELHELREAFEK